MLAARLGRIVGKNGLLGFRERCPQQAALCRGPLLVRFGGARFCDPRGDDHEDLLLTFLGRCLYGLGDGLP
jgi:hypothetical protein